MENVEGKDIGDQQHRTGGVRQLMDQFFHSRAVAHLHRDIDAVSYTHLDVYKRQKNNQWNKLFREMIRTIVVRAISHNGR